MMLGQIYCELDDQTKACEVGKEAAQAFERARQFDDAARAILLTAQWMGLDKARDGVERFNRLVEEAGCGPQIRNAITAYEEEIRESTSGIEKVREADTIHIADEVRAAMGSRDVDPMIEHLLTSAMRCLECELRIEAGTPAELIIVRDARAGRGTLCVAHSNCLES